MENNIQLSKPNMNMLIPQQQINMFNKIFIASIFITFFLGHLIMPIKVFGIIFYGYRYMILLSFLFIFHYKFASPIEKNLFIVSVVWTVYGTISLFWTPNFIDGSKELMNVIFGLYLSFLMLSIIDINKVGLRNIVNLVVNCWTLIFLCSLVFVYMELKYNISFKIEDGALVNYPRRSQGVTSLFGNSNDYGPFVVITFCLFLFRLLTAKVISIRVIYLLLSIIAFAIVIMTAGRTTFLAIAFVVVGIVFYRIRRFTGILFLLKVLPLFIGAIVIAYLLNPSAYQKHVVKTQSELTSDKDGSIKKRIKASVNGLYIIYKTYGVGGGANSYVHLIKNSDMPYPIGEKKLTSHNYFITIASQYGLIIFGFLLWWFIYIVITLNKIRKFMVKNECTYETMLCEILLVTIVSMVFIAVAMGGHLDSIFIWIMIATITLFTSSLYVLWQKMQNINSYLINQK